jgi:hypothetical protein
MPSLLKRGKKDEGVSAQGDRTANGADGHPTGVGTEGHGAGMNETGTHQPAQAPSPPRPAPEPPSTYELPGAGAADFDPPISYEPAPPPPPSPRSSGSLLQRALGDPGEQSPEERDRIAAMEFEQAISPVLEMMRAAVPGANTPEEAARILSENQGEITPDPHGGAYVPGDAFDADARVYYRLLRRDYEKNPRPSEKKSVSHHLHGVYNKLPGTRGW